MKVGFKNLRSLQDTGKIDIKPITILLGQNSSGKSTFLRTFPLLKQSIEARTRGPILWYGRFVDFGDFTKAVCDDAKDKFIEYYYELEDFQVHNYQRRHRSINFEVSLLNLVKKLDLSLQVRGDKEGKTYCSQINLELMDFIVEMKVTNQGQSVDELSVDGELLLDCEVIAANFGHNFVPQVLFKDPANGHFSSSSEILSGQIKKEIRNIARRKLKEETIESIIKTFDFSSNQKLLDSILAFEDVTSFKKGVAEWKLETPEYKRLKMLLILITVPIFLELSDHAISKIAKNTSYIAPLRATAERYYRPQDLSVDEVDFQGKNLALVLRNLSIREQRDFEKWAMEHFGFCPITSDLGGNLTIKVKFRKGNSEHNIADLGFGFSQILPIVTQIWIGSVNSNNRFSYSDDTSKIYVIEQPELHLHPKLQARLVDAFVSVVNYLSDKKEKVHFILETHSETIVNAIGTRVYKKKLSQDDVNVVLFERELGLSKSSVRQVNYNKDGVLINWPFGFFDEGGDLDFDEDFRNTQD